MNNLINTGSVVSIMDDPVIHSDKKTGGLDGHPGRNTDTSKKDDVIILSESSRFMPSFEEHVLKALSSGCGGTLILFAFFKSSKGNEPPIHRLICQALGALKKVNVVTEVILGEDKGSVSVRCTLTNGACIMALRNVSSS